MGKWLVCLALSLVGCSSTGAGGTGAGGNAAASGGSAGSAASGAGTSSSSGGNSSGGTSTAAAGASNGGASDAFTSTLVSAPTQLRGNLGIAQYRADKTNFTTNIDLDFGSTRGQWDGCTRNQLGACWYYDCPPGSNPIGADGNIPPVYYDAGTATITGIPPAINAPFDSGNGQYFARPTQQLWPLAGGTVTVSLSGGDVVPAFTMQVTTPGMVWLTSINGQAAPTSITRSDGVKLVWTSAGSGNVYFFVYELTGTRPAAVCQFDAAANFGNLPATVLEKLDPGTSYYLEFRGDMRAEMMTGDWDMSAFAYAFGFDLSGSSTQPIELK